MMISQKLHFGVKFGLAYVKIFKKQGFTMQQTIQFRVDKNYVDIVINILNGLNSLKLNVIHDLSISENLLYESTNQEIKAFSNHTANLVEEWKDEEEDDVWI